MSYLATASAEDVGVYWASLVESGASTSYLNVKADIMKARKEAGSLSEVTNAFMTEASDCCAEIMESTLLTERFWTDRMRRLNDRMHDLELNEPNHLTGGSHAN